MCEGGVTNVSSGINDSNNVEVKQIQLLNLMRTSTVYDVVTN